VSGVPPFVAIWEGDGFRPLRRFQKILDSHFVCGRPYTLEERMDRSAASHRQFFATVKDLWANLPQKYDGRWCNETLFRATALAMTGFATVVDHVVDTPDEAARFEVMARAMRATRSDSVEDYKLVLAQGNVVRIYHPWSQAYRAMDKDTFQRSSQAVMEWCSALVGVTVEEAQNVGRHA
jgi:hypothetical protein